MNKFITLKSHLVGIPLKDIDTDMIIPAQFLTSVSRAGFGENLFHRLKQDDPNFPLSHPGARGAKVLVADSNFGCGSSREHAVWALQGAGFEAVIAPSFADIYAANSTKNGLVLIALEREQVLSLLEKSCKPEEQIEIDLPQQIVRSGAQVYRFPFDPFRKHCIVEGIDDFEYIMAERAAIDSFKQRAKAQIFLETKSCQ